MGLRQNIKFWFPVILWMGFIFWMSTGIGSARNTAFIIEPVLRFFAPGMSLQALDVAHEVLRKCAHVFEYFILGFLLFRAFRGNSHKGRGWRLAIYSMCAVVAYAISDEWHQAFAFGRFASAYDVVIDASGGIIAQAVSVMRLYSGGRLKSG